MRSSSVSQSVSFILIGWMITGASGGAIYVHSGVELSLDLL